MSSQPIQLHHYNLTAVILFISIAIASRFVGPLIFGQPSNFAPVNAIALFSGAYIMGRHESRWLSLLLPIFFVWIGDMLINFSYYGAFVPFYPGFYWQYATYAVLVLMSYFIFHRRVTVISVCVASLSASLLFFTISNFGVWTSGLLYPLNIDGLIACYVAAIPFFKQTVSSDLLYCGILFGAFEGLKRYSPQWAIAKVV